MKIRAAVLAAVRGLGLAVLAIVGSLVLFIGVFLVPVITSVVRSHDALDTQAAELRRIERDLHDGAQARLVAMA